MELFAFMPDNTQTANTNDMDLSQINLNYDKYAAHGKDALEHNWDTFGQAMQHVTILFFENSFESFMFHYADRAQKLDSSVRYVSSWTVFLFYCIAYIIVSIIGGNLVTTIFLESIDFVETKHANSASSGEQVKFNLFCF